MAVHCDVSRDTSSVQRTRTVIFNTVSKKYHGQYTIIPTPTL